MKNPQWTGSNDSGGKNMNIQAVRMERNISEEELQLEGVMQRGCERQSSHLRVVGNYVTAGNISRPRLPLLVN